MVALGSRALQPARIYTRRGSAGNPYPPPPPPPPCPHKGVIVVVVEVCMHPRQAKLAPQLPKSLVAAPQNPLVSNFWAGAKSEFVMFPRGTLFVASLLRYAFLPSCRYPVPGPLGP